MSNKYQEALDRIKRNIYRNWVEESRTNDCKTIQELVDKATPMKPIRNDFEEDCCPNCSSLEIQIELSGYEQTLSLNSCQDCRQAIDWSNNE